jgi:Down syndrome cell adhesion protein 1
LSYLSLKFLPVLPQIVPFNFGEEQINLNDWVSATCSVNKGDLPIQITWILTDDSGQEKILSTDDGIVITRTNQRSSMLSIEQVKPHHRGNFTCRVSNRGGGSQHSTYLHINGFYFGHSMTYY